MSQSDSHYGESDEARYLIEHAAAAAMQAAEETLAPAGAELKKMFVLLFAEGVPEGQPDATSAGRGYEDAEDLMAEVFGHFRQSMKQLGVTVEIARLGRG